MSTERLLKSVYSYLDVLAQSHTDVVAHWDQQALDKAFQWADFCQQIYARCQGKAYKDELETKVAMLNTLPWALGSRVVNLELLGRASQELTSVLLQNRHLNAVLYEYLLTKVFSPEVNGKDIIQEFSKLSSCKSAGHISQILTRALRKPSDNNLPLEELQVFARLMLEHITRVMQTMPEEKRDRTETVLRQKIKKILEGSYGPDIIMRALIKPLDETKPSLPSTKHRFILQVVETWIAEETEKAKRIWTLSPDLLTEVCKLYPSICNLYLEYLREVGQAMHPEYPDLDFGCSFTGPQVIWSSPGMAYEELCLRYRKLKQSCYHLERKTNAALEYFAGDSEYSIWRSISKEISK